MPRLAASRLRISCRFRFSLDAFLGHGVQIRDGGGVQHLRVGQQCLLHFRPALVPRLRHRAAGGPAEALSSTIAAGTACPSPAARAFASSGVEDDPGWPHVLEALCGECAGHAFQLTVLPRGFRAADWE